MNRLALVAIAGVAALGGYVFLTRSQPQQRPKSDLEIIADLAKQISGSAARSSTAGKSLTTQQRAQLATNLRAQQAADAANRLLTQPRF